MEVRDDIHFYGVIGCFNAFRFVLEFNINFRLTLEHGTLGLKLRTLMVGHCIPIKRRLSSIQVSVSLILTASVLYAMHATNFT